MSGKYIILWGDDITRRMREALTDHLGITEQEIDEAMYIWIDVESVRVAPKTQEDAA